MAMNTTRSVEVGRIVALGGRQQRAGGCVHPGIGIVVGAGQRTVSLVEHDEDSVAAALPHRAACDRVDEPPSLLVAALDVIVLRATRPPPPPDPTTHPLHVA